MPAFFYNLHVLAALIIIYIIFGSIGFAGYKINQRFFKKSNNQNIVTMAQQTSITFGTLFIAFWIALNWQTLDNLNLDTQHEAQAIISIYNSTNMVENPQERQIIQNDIKLYLNSVINDEYKSLENGKPNLNTQLLLNQLGQKIYLLPTTDLEQKLVYMKLIDSLNSLIDFRLKRLDYAAGQINGVLLIFFIMLLVLICFWSGCINNNYKKLTIMVILSQNLIILSSAWLILEIDRPFQGYFRVDNKAFVAASYNLEKLDTKLVAHQ